MLKQEHTRRITALQLTEGNAVWNGHPSLEKKNYQKCQPIISSVGKVFLWYLSLLRGNFLRSLQFHTDTDVKVYSLNHIKPFNVCSSI